MSSRITHLVSVAGPSGSATISPAEDQVRRLEYEWGLAYERGDIELIDRILADEYVLTDPLGNVCNRAESLRAVASGDVVFESTYSDDVRVSVIDDTAVVTARSTFRGCYKGWSICGRYQYTDVFVKRQGSWVAVASHITALQAAPLRLRFGHFMLNCLKPLLAALRIL